MSLREAVRLGYSKRTDFPIMKSKAALLIIDVQRYCCDGSSAESSYYAQHALPQMKNNIMNLLSVFRSERDGVSLPRGCEVIFVVIQSMTRDRRDLSLDYKLSGPYFALVPTVDMSYEEIFLPEIMPDTSTGKGDIFVPKTACSVFTSTNIKFVLDNLLIEQLVVCGQLTDQCVESAVRDAADLGFLVTVVDDACAAHSEDSHNKGLSGMRGFCRVVTTKQVVQEMSK
jgi:ureidoacrylate peracid hydrolase